MLKYTPCWVEHLADYKYLWPLSQAAGAAPNDDAAKHLPVLNAFMEPLVELYGTLPPKDMPSDDEIREQATHVARYIAGGFAPKATESGYQLAAAAARGEAKPVSIRTVLCLLNAFWVCAHEQAIRIMMEIENEGTAKSRRQSERLAKTEVVRAAMDKVFNQNIFEPEPDTGSKVSISGSADRSIASNGSLKRAQTSTGSSSKTRGTRGVAVPKKPYSSRSSRNSRNSVGTGNSRKTAIDLTSEKSSAEKSTQGSRSTGAGVNDRAAQRRR